MASVDYRKCKSGTGDAAALLRHCDAEERMRHEHSNPHIDPALTPGNRQGPRSYQRTLEALRDRLAELDAQPGANRRKDRVELFLLEVPVPAGHDPGAFARMVVGEIADMYGARNVLQAYLHVDEVHEYLDHGELKTSLPHLHVPVVPEVDGKLNGKAFSARARMEELNRRIDRGARALGGPPFLTGKTPRKRSVEELKAQSYKDARQEAARARQEAQSAVKAAHMAHETAEALQERVRGLQGQAEDLERLIERREADISIDDRLRGARAELTLADIRRDHPELFDERGRYRRGRKARDGRNLTL